MYVKHLQCISCGKEYPATPQQLTCSECGPDGILDVIYDYSQIQKVFTKENLAINRDHSIWRYMPLLPIDPNVKRPSLRVGGTPIYYAKKLGKAIGVEKLYLKDDGLNPTGSLKDRASSIAVVKAVEAGAKIVACSSTGNAASSLAGNVASLNEYDLKACIFVPERAPAGKIAQLLIYGAIVISVEGSYEDAFNLSAAAIEKYGWYNRNAAINPYLVEGKKTVAFEICEQLNWEAPDWAVFSVGDGCTIAGAYKGFYDLYQLGMIDKIPKLIGVQAEGCAPLTRAWETGEPWQKTEENTLADSIAVGSPRNPEKALNAVRKSQGMMVNVSDEEILKMQTFIGRHTGVFGEPAGVTGFAGLKKLIDEKKISPEDSYVVVITGNGLKDIANARKAAGEPVRIAPDLEKLDQLLKEYGLIDKL
ncbi:threonine synthase [Anoxybacter fermentans]|uniref:Threonine synthase n=1 Tax=Anoxybacter fermentans TaxID=1323375 RepID=A0A3S9SZ65_9FIRM|nr:threonine synthase [Anoxybacter fermentans]AZR73607.1 threonine synthase [Anoxybacter fermentans]